MIDHQTAGRFNHSHLGTDIEEVLKLSLCGGFEQMRYVEVLEMNDAIMIDGLWKYANCKSRSFQRIQLLRTFWKDSCSIFFC